MEGSSPPGERSESGNNKWYEKTQYQILLFLAGMVLFSIVLWFALNSYIAPKTSTEKKDLVQALGLITVGLAGAVGIFFTWRGQRITQRDQERTQRNTQEQLRLSRQSQEDNQRDTQEQLKQSRNELDIARRGQITENFTKAIDQLGSTELEITLGGIYSLERTAREDRDYHWPIMEVLTTYIRTHAPRTGMYESTEPYPAIQAVLTVIGRRTFNHRDVEYGPIDLHTTSLQSANLREADLSEANLSRANLSRADLFKADLSRANLREAILKEASIAGADLSGADLSGADLFKAELFRVRLSGADLSGADLSGADLFGADLSNAALHGTNLSRANLREAVVTQEQLKEAATGDEHTELPTDLWPPAHWRKRTDEKRNSD